MYLPGICIHVAPAGSVEIHQVASASPYSWDCTIQPCHKLPLAQHPALRELNDPDQVLFEDMEARTNAVGLQGPAEESTLTQPLARFHFFDGGYLPCRGVADTGPTSIGAVPNCSASDLDAQFKSAKFTSLESPLKVRRLTNESQKAFENTSTSVAASQMRNALNNLADTVADPEEKKLFETEMDNFFALFRRYLNDKAKGNTL
jgi:hypothetical protein